MWLQVNHTFAISTCPVRKQHWFVNQFHLLKYKWKRQLVEIRQFARQPHKRNCFAGGGHKPSSSFLTDFWFVLHFASAFTTRGSMRRYLQPTEVAQVVHLIQDDTSMRAVARRLDASPSTVLGARCTGQAMKQACAPGDIKEAVGGQPPSSRTAIWSFVQGGIRGALPEPRKTTFSRPLMCMFLLTDQLYAAA